MTVEITLKLPENLVAQAHQLGLATQRDVGDVLANALELLWLSADGSPEFDETPIAELADEAVLLLADSKMDEVQNLRMGDLQAKGKAESLTAAERYELFALLQIYQLGQLRKSEALAEAVRRGLRQPLPA